MDAVVKEVEKELPDANIGSDGLEIYTTLDPKAQKLADNILNNNIIDYPNDKFKVHSHLWIRKQEKFVL